jgi:hypothetical protein
MPIKTFLCWSGVRSRKLAEAVADWLPGALGDRVETAMSTQIEKGAEWFEELLSSLDNASCGILCLTPEAMDSRWIHFESGLLVRALSQIPDKQAGASPARRVFPLLYGVKSGTLAGPLASYQSTVVTEFDDVVRLLEAIYQFLPEPERVGLDDLRSSWRRRWSALQQRIADIPGVPLKEILPDFEEYFRRKTFQERMHDCLSQDWIERYNGAYDTQRELKRHVATVRLACRPFIADVYDELVAALDSYSMGLSKLVGRPESPIDAQGVLVFESPGLAIACERQRTKVRRLVSRLVDERLAPSVDEAFRFELAETFEEKKQFIHRKTAELDRHQAAIRNGADSDWDFDRILYYVWQEERGEFDLSDAIYRTRLELEKVNTKNAGWSLMPLSYSLGPLEKALSQPGAAVDAATASQVKALSTDIRAFIERTGTDSGAQVRGALTRIEQLLTRRTAPTELPGSRFSAPGP